MIALLRVLFIFLGTVLPAFFYLQICKGSIIIVSAVSLFLSFLFLFIIEYLSHVFTARKLVSAIIGLFIGGFVGYFVSVGFSFLELPIDEKVINVIRFAIMYLFSFFVMFVFVIKNEEISFLDKVVANNDDFAEGKISYKILDTSVIIDGRISDLSDTGFLEGVLVIPNFVLNELQSIADSLDSIKRNRGRRGLDILNKMQKDSSIKIKISDMDFADISEVDAKLVKLAKVMNAKVVTNDFNLNKVAEFHGVHVLNINLLANALKPIVLPGEELHVSLVKEGKDQNQAIGYLDDGTMVVVENGRKKLNNDVDVVVTSALQTTAGRMIFGRIKE